MNKTLLTGEYTPASVRGGAVQGSAEDNNWRIVYMAEVKELAKKDFAAGIRMGEAYRAMEQDAMTAHISPGREMILPQTEDSLWKASGQTGDTLELPGGFRAELSGGTVPTAEVYDPNGECIASYSSLSGWTEHQTIAEREFWRESRDTYLAAWNGAMSASKPKAVKKSHMDVTA